MQLLAHLHVGRCRRAADVGIGKLAESLPSLTGIELPQCWCSTDASVHDFLALTALTTLDMSNWTIADPDMHRWLKLTALRRLRLGLVTNATLKILGDLFPSQIYM
eukprot:evm.model.scf_3672.1 EVM.evm.TU.scf_3672.1   scf_3672:10501-10818(-)